jgi:hypothetical protein
VEEAFGGISISDLSPNPVRLAVPARFSGPLFSHIVQDPLRRLNHHPIKPITHHTDDQYSTTLTPLHNIPSFKHGSKPILKLYAKTTTMISNQNSIPAKNKKA